jgi:DNA-binding NtrC family response regulator
MPLKILIVNDKHEQSYSGAATKKVVKVLADNGYEAVVVATLEQVKEHLVQGFAVALIDVEVTGGPVAAWKVCRNERPEMDVLILAPGGQIPRLARQYQNEGLTDRDFVSKQLLATHLIRTIEDLSRVRALQEQLNNSVWDEVVGSSAIFAQVIEEAKKAAAAERPIFLVGATGTGKGVVAKGIHAFAGRTGNFVRRELGSLSGEFLQSELFGHRKGAFTSAIEDRSGALRDAHNGTLFLDEFQNLGLKHQEALLSVLESQDAIPLGGSEEHKYPFQVRIIAASNRHPRDLFEQGLLRSDVYYRMGRVIYLPALKERKEDIPELARFFLRRKVGEGRTPPVFSVEAMQLLLDHEWPGNVRELQHVVERLAEDCRSSAILVGDITLDRLVTGHRHSSVVDLKQPWGRLLRKLWSEYSPLMREQFSQKTERAHFIGVDVKTLDRWDEQGGPRPEESDGQDQKGRVGQEPARTHVVPSLPH